MKIDLPGTFKHVPTSCDAWLITTTLAYPADAANRYKGIITPTGDSSSDPRTFYCNFKASAAVDAADQALLANTAYGISLAAASSTVLQGAYAPIGLQTT